MPAWSLILPALKHGTAQVVKHWRLCLLALLTLVVLRYVWTAEAAKRELAQLQIRAEMAEAQVKYLEDSTAVLTHAIDSLKQRIAARPQPMAPTVKKMRGTRIVVVDETPTPTPDQPATDTSKVPAPGDTIPLSEHPLVKELQAVCDTALALRDTVIRLQDTRHALDQQVITQLKIQISTPRTPTPPTWQRVALRVATGAVIGSSGAMAGQQIGGRPGIAVGALTGALVGFLIR